MGITWAVLGGKGKGGEYFLPKTIRTTAMHGTQQQEVRGEVLW